MEERKLINCLRNERVVVRFVPEPNSRIQDPKHLLYGGMAENGIRKFVVPRTSQGKFVEVLDKDEQDFLEDALGLKPGAMGIHFKENNFWSDANPEDMTSVTLRRQDNFIDLSTPEGYIKYKVLLANKDKIAPSLKVLEESPKATYQFVIIGGEEEVTQAKAKMSDTMKCYKEYGKIEEDKHTLSCIIEILTGKSVAKSAKIEFLQTQINTLIQNNPKKFLATVTDKKLPVKVLIRRSIDLGSITRRGDYLYLRSDGKPLCNDGEEPTLETAALYLLQPKHQQIKFALEAELKND